MNFLFIKHRKIFYIVSTILAIASIVAIVIFGLNLGIDFTGGSLIEITYKSGMPDFEEIQQALEDIDLGNFTLQGSGEKGIILKTQNIETETREKVLARLVDLAEIEQGAEHFQLIGPVIGKELKKKTRIVIVLALIAILLYIAFSFRRVARPVKSYIYGLTSLIALCHDVLIPLGIFAVLGRINGVEITIPLITAFLTVFGYSINDSVVVFDRVRENLLKQRLGSFDLTIEKSLNQSLTRSINTSLTTLLVLFAIFFFGGESLKYFSLALILGISAGTYSSLFLATPLLTSFFKFKERKYRR